MATSSRRSPDVTAGFFGSHLSHTASGLMGGGTTMSQVREAGWNMMHVPQRMSGATWGR
jgi:hypothetical protein